MATLTFPPKLSPSSKHAKGPRPPSGLVPNWQKVQRIESRAPTSFRPGKRDSATGSGYITSEFDSASDTLNTPHRNTGCPSIPVDRSSSRATSSGERDVDEASYGYGGFVPDDEGSERRTWEVKSEGTEQEKKSASRYKSITKIRDIHSTALRGTKLTNSHKKKAISFDNLPQGTTLHFKKVVALALDTTGALKPWATPGDDVIIEIWNLVFGDDHPIVEGDTECYHFVVVQTLIKRAISGWVHKFAEAAEKALAAEFTHQGLQTEEERSAFVQRLLGDADDISDKRRPFIWESSYDDNSARLEGIFQGRLVTRTFFEHIQSVNSVDAEHRVQEKPIGALIYSIQAVHRALLYSTTGTFKPPTDKKSAEFSKNNRGGL